MNALIDRASRQEGRHYKVILLTGPDDPETIILQRAVVNDLTSEAGRSIAFTQGQRYVSLERLRTARTTSELVR